jgi:O-antigen/teichoic acid export membrane protein
MKNRLSNFDWSYVYAFFGEATLALTFIFYILIARVLGPEDYGIFAAAIALAAILSFFIQFGLPTLLNREVAAHPDTAPRNISLFLALESLMSTAVLVLLFPLGQLLGYRGEVLIVCYLAIFIEIGRSMIMTLRSAVKGLGWFRAESIAVAIERVAVVAISTTVLLQTRSLIPVVASVAIVRGVHIIGMLIYVSRQANIFTQINWKRLFDTLEIAYTFAMFGVLWVLYYQVDVVMLKTLSTGEETGFYSALYRILEMFSALPRVIFYVIFTRFAKCHVSAPKNCQSSFIKRLVCC